MYWLNLLFSFSTIASVFSLIVSQLVKNINKEITLIENIFFTYL